VARPMAKHSNAEIPNAVQALDRFALNRECPPSVENLDDEGEGRRYNQKFLARKS
jgi:hypothetical protein